MKFRRRRIRSSSDGSMGGQLLSLSLFVMLLAFFIVLNAISTFEQVKVKPAMQSLGETFASKISEFEKEHPSVTENVAKSLDEGSTLDQLQNLFESQIPSNNSKIDRSTGTMHLEVPFDEFEEAVMSIGQPEAAQGKKSDGDSLLKGFFLPALVALVKNDAVARPYRMDIAINIADNPAAIVNENPQRIRKMMERSSNIALKIESAGLPERLMSVGLKNGKADTVELFFRPHVPYNPMEGEHGKQ